MLGFSKLALTALTIGMGFLVGCNSGGAQTPASHEMASDAVKCDKCEVTWVKVPATPGGGKSTRIIGYTSRKEMQCPDCRSAVSNFFATGKLQHACSACGGNMVACEAH